MRGVTGGMQGVLTGTPYRAISWALESVGLGPWRLALKAGRIKWSFTLCVRVVIGLLVVVITLIIY